MAAVPINCGMLFAELGSATCLGRDRPNAEVGRLPGGRFFNERHKYFSRPAGMFFGRRKEQRKKRLFDVEVEREECFELGRGLDALPDVKKALEGALPVGGVLDEVCFRTLVGEDVPHGSPPPLMRRHMNSHGSFYAPYGDQPGDWTYRWKLRN
jgi:hypothetical protein